MTALLLHLLILLVLQAGTASAQPAPPRESAYVQESWGLQDGLPPGGLEGMAQTPDGYLWLATASGLVRFDGVNFDRWPLPSTFPEGTSEAVFSLVAARDGALWVGLANSGIVRIAKDAVRKYDAGDGLERTRVTGLLEDRDGSIWASTRLGLFHLQGERWVKLGANAGFPTAVVLSTFEDRRGGLWAGTAMGVYRRPPGESRFTRITDEGPFFPRFAEDSLGDVWMTDPQFGYRPLSNGRPSTRERPAGAGYRIVSDRTGQLWVGTLGQGLWRIDPRAERGPNVEWLLLRNEASSTAITSLFCDREGAIWAGTESGLYRFSRRTLHSIAGLSQVRALAATRDGAVWIGTASGLYKSSEERRPLYDRVATPGGPVVTALHAASDGALWVATNAGISRLVDGRFHAVVAEGPFLNRAYSIASDSTGAVWVCDDSHGVFVWTRDRPATFFRHPRLTQCSAVSPSATRPDRVWISVPSGALVEVGRDGSDGPPGGDGPAGRSGSAAPSPDTRRVVSANNDSLSLHADGRTVILTSANGLPDSRIVSGIEDAERNVWIGTLTGIVKVQRAEIERLHANPQHKMAFQLFDSVDGAATPKPGNPGAARTRDGSLWFATAAGVTIIDPSRLARDAEQPLPVHVRAVVADGRTWPSDAPLDLPSGTRAVQFTYTAVGFSSPRSIRFEYLLEGFDRDWVDSGTRRETIYTNLPPRSYRFRVRATGKSGARSMDEGLVAFTIAPAFYRTRTFGGILGLAFVGTVALAWQMHTRRLRQRFALILAERMRISREIHDTLLQGLIGIALRIGSMAEEFEPDSRASADLTRTREIAERFIRETRDSIWRMREPARSATPLVALLQEMAGRMAVQGGTSVRIELTGSALPLPPEVEDQLFRVSEEAVSNAVRHARASQVLVALHYGDDAVTIAVRDDGCGFDLSSRRPEATRHYGLAMMRERAQAVSGSFSIRSRPGAGTEVTMTVPRDAGRHPPKRQAYAGAT